jgi:hypothetical protein
VRERYDPGGLPAGVTGNLLYVQSGELAKRVALSYDSLAADMYWIRVLQHYGRTKLSTETNKQYDLLFPLLDLTTTLDPRFDIAYRFGAVFLAEAPPSGPGRADQAIALLEKGLREQPGNWEFAQDIGFVYYWWMQDYAMAAEWFKRGGGMPGAPNWLPALAAVTLARGGSRESSRQLWQQVLQDAEVEWLRTQARFRLAQLDAMDQMAALDRLLRTYDERSGTQARSWLELIRAGVLAGVPVDPEGHPYQINQATGAVELSPSSPLNPLPKPEQAFG